MFVNPSAQLTTGADGTAAEAQARYLSTQAALAHTRSVAAAAVRTSSGAAISSDELLRRRRSPPTRRRTSSRSRSERQRGGSGHARECLFASVPARECGSRRGEHQQGHQGRGRSDRCDQPSDRGRQGRRHQPFGAAIPARGPDQAATEADPAQVDPADLCQRCTTGLRGDTGEAARQARCAPGCGRRVGYRNLRRVSG